MSALHLHLTTAAPSPRDAFGRDTSPSGLALLRDAARRAAAPRTCPARDEAGRWHWPGSPWRGSVSHAGPRGLAGVTEGTWIGVDIQDERPRPGAIGWLAGVLDLPADRVTLRHWAETEALLKAKGIAGVRPAAVGLPAWREGWRQTPCGWWLWSRTLARTGEHIAVAAQQPRSLRWSSPPDALSPIVNGRRAVQHAALGAPPEQSVRRGILATIGDTPLVGLRRLEAARGVRVFAKLERFNPTGSIEDRVALGEVLAPIRGGDLVPGGVLVADAASADLAVSLALVCCYFGVELHAVVDAEAVTDWHRAMASAYGARLVPVGGSARVACADELVAALPGSYRLGRSRRAGGTGGGDLLGEVRAALPAEPDYVYCPTSSMTALRFCLAHIRAHRLATRVVAVDDAGRGDRLADLPLGRFDRAVAVGPDDAETGRRLLLEAEGILAGASSGAVLSAFTRTAPPPPDSVCVLIFPDGGDRPTGPEPKSPEENVPC
ncbi:cysteine synthase [Catenulispora sp. GP43]|uniref:pyridoxal-phosphate dependent enzyme n=1 Tax=Catenulispora sp. GP43 TaxID=3156263 RepID=UPI0035147A16